MTGQTEQPRDVPPDEEELDRRNEILYWWPVASRLLGIAIVVLGLSVFKSQSASLLALAAGLFMAPEIQFRQHKRNRRRDEENPPGT